MDTPAKDEGLKPVRWAWRAVKFLAGLVVTVHVYALILFFAYCYPIARWTIALERRYAVKL